MGKWTRRALLTTGVLAGGALAVGVALRPGHRAPKLAPLVTRDGEVLVSSWVKIDRDNRVTLIAAHSEMGQGTHTALVQMLAEELDSRWEDTHFMEAPAVDEYANGALGKGFLAGEVDFPKILVPTIDGAFQQIADVMHLQITGGSSSVRATGVHGVRVAGAAAREMLLRAAADAWNLPVAELDARDTQLVHAPSGRTAPFAEFATAAAAFRPSATPRLKAPADFRIMGTHRPRRDIPSKVDGSARFGIDAEVPGMQYAAIAAAPVFGAQLETVDAAPALAMDGVQQVVELDDAVAVVADGYWHASRALAALDVRWSATDNDSMDSAALFERFAADTAAVDAGDWSADAERGDVAAGFAAAGRTGDGYLPRAVSRARLHGTHERYGALRGRALRGVDGHPESAGIPP